MVFSKLVCTQLPKQGSMFLCLPWKSCMQLSASWQCDITLNVSVHQWLSIPVAYYSHLEVRASPLVWAVPHKWESWGGGLEIGVFSESSPDDSTAYRVNKTTRPYKTSQSPVKTHNFLWSLILYFNFKENLKGVF